MSYTQDQRNKSRELQQQISECNNQDYVKTHMSNMLLDLMGCDRIKFPELINEKDGIRLQWNDDKIYASVRITFSGYLIWNLLDKVTDSYTLDTYKPEMIVNRDVFFFPEEVLERIQLPDDEFEHVETAPRINVNLKWHCNYWDGPISGICEYDGKLHWFQQRDETDFSRMRLYSVHEMSNEDIAFEQMKHDRFREYVGTHTDYEDGKRAPGVGVKPRDQWNSFYDWVKELPPPSDYKTGTVIGYFTL